MDTEKAPDLPTVSVLAYMAATMATPVEKADDTAKRAMLLWHACRKQLWSDSNSIERARKQREEDDAFFAACGLTPYDCWISVWCEEFVTLAKFLKAIRPDYKFQTMFPKWREFWKFETAMEIPKWPNRPDESHRDYYVLPNLLDGIIGERSLITCRDRFMKFIEKKTNETNVRKGNKAARARLIRRITRKFIAGNFLTTEDREMLAGLSAEEEQTEIKKLDMTPAQARKWKAEIQTCRTPPKGLPRFVRKKTVD